MIGPPCLEFPPFAFDGIARHRRGWQRPIAIRVQHPFSDRPGEYVCPVNCSLLQIRTHFPRSNEAQDSYSLAFVFLRIALSDFSLFTFEGAHVDLPRHPPWENDWVPPKQTPERGLTMRPNAVGPDGEIGIFFVAISPPRRDGSGYVAEICYGREEPVAATIRGQTAAGTYNLAISLLEDWLEKDRLTLLDNWNEPIDLERLG